MLILSGVLAFDIMDRLTGSWTVMDSDWMIAFANPMIKQHPVRAQLPQSTRVPPSRAVVLVSQARAHPRKHPPKRTCCCLPLVNALQLVWLIMNMLFWSVVVFACVRLLSLMVFATQGVTTIRLQVTEKLIMERFYTFVASKVTSIEDRGFDGSNYMVRVCCDDPSPATKLRTLLGRPLPHARLAEHARTSRIAAVQSNTGRRLREHTVCRIRRSRAAHYFRV